MEHSSIFLEVLYIKGDDIWQDGRRVRINLREYHICEVKGERKSRRD